ncbi:Acetylornithine aminotransferase [Mucinivorans hirudinis]|uniref:Acetylornithine aminotransferase n=1 Tax=Mucinivorans hirudinis TaxID=1433126 RepID=A0A060RAB4_9BACT|nr:Acetylornithine aminotransferase [Mucinivorans hirudinis]
MKLFDVYPLYDIEIARACGSRVYDKNGVEYLDMYGGHAVISIGHTNEHYVKRLNEQLAKIGFYSNSVIIPQQKELADLLGKLTGKDDYQLFLCNSGAEANENAMKLASFATGRKKIVAFRGSFHGRTSLAVAATDNAAIVAPANETSNVIFLPFNNIEALKALFAECGTEVAAVITEAIQGVGGIRIANNEFLKTIRTLCDVYGAKFIADGVQDGCGRTGNYFAHDSAGIKADIYTMAKGIGNGFPLAGLLISPDLKPKYGMLGTTFGGNHLACTAGIAVAEEMLAKDMVKNAAQMGEYLIGELSKLQNIKEVRGKGLMIGIELNEDYKWLRDKLLYTHKIFVGTAGKTIIRLLPALNITKEDCDRTIAAFKAEL